MSGRLRWATAVSAALLFACPAIARAQGYANPVPINVNGLQIETTTAIGIEDGEPLTPPSNNGEGICTTFGPGAHMADTFWWKFTAPSGSTHDIILSSEGSNFDTQLAVYDAPEPGSFDNFLGCSNDPDSSPFGAAVLTPVPGATYLVQVGGCDDDVSGTCPSQPGADDLSGEAWFAALTNDDRTNPLTINPGRTTRTNVGATTDGTELTSCGGAQYGKTVWFRYTAPAEGDVTYSTTVVDTVLSAYRGSTRLRCNDDAGDANAAEIGFHVDKGQTYLIQVGGKVDGGFTNFGGFTEDLKFTEDRDHDNDGYNRGPDCNDNNPSIHPNAPSIPGNGVAENCVSDPPIPPDLDKDNDNINDDVDCDDDNPAIHQGAAEVPGNKVDENCDARIEDYTRIPARYAYLTKRGHVVRFRSLRVTSIPAGATLRLTCTGKGCKGKRKYSRRFRNARARFDLLKRVKQHRLKKGAVVEIRITAPNMIGRVFRIKALADGDSTGSDRCLRPGARRTTRCT